MKSAKKYDVGEVWIMDIFIFRMPLAVAKAIIWFIERLITNTRIWFLIRAYFLLPIKSISNHLFMIAWSWSGKSEFLKLIVYYLIKIDKSNSVVVMDPHWDLAKQIARWKVWLRHERVILFDGFLKTWYLPWFNPFLLRDKSERNINIKTQALIRSFQGMLDNAFTQRMETLLKYLLPVLLRREHSSFKDLKRFVEVWDYANNQDLLEMGLNSPNYEHREYFSNDFADRSLDVSKKWLRDRISSFLASPIFVGITTVKKNTINWEEAINGWKVMIVNLAKWNYGEDVAQALWNLIVGHMQYLAFKRVSMPEHRRNKVYLVIDEFQNFTVQDPKRIENMLSEVRKYWFSLLLANQYPKQIRPELREAIDENTKIRIAWFSQKDEEYKKLRPGEFIIDIWWIEREKYRAPTFLLDYCWSMTRRKWEKIRYEQTKIYYKKIIKSKEVEPNWIARIEYDVQKELEEFIPKI